MPECVLSDSIIEFTIYKSSRVYPDKLRRVVYLDKETDVTYTYLTNDLTSSALVIANLYKNRWRVELFFKWVKQHDMKLERSIYEILQILVISLTDKTHLHDLFDKKNINDLYDLYGSNNRIYLIFNRVLF